MNLAQRYAVMGRKRGPLAPLGPKLALHLESDFGVTTVGGKVSEWAGREGFRNTAIQATDVNRPTLVSGVLDGKPAIRFAGAQWLQSASQVGINIGDLPRLYVVASIATSNPIITGIFISFDTTTPGNYQCLAMYRANVNAFMSRRTYRSDYASVDNTVGLGSKPALFDGRNEPTSITLALNGIDAASTGVGAVLDLRPTQFDIGRYPSNAYHLVGDIFQIIVLTNPTPEMHAFVIDYLAKKYPSIRLAPVRPPLPASAVEYWHSELGFVPGNGVTYPNGTGRWFGQIKNRALSHNLNVNVAVDAPYFNARNVIKTYHDAAAWMRGENLESLFGAGSYPWIYIIARKWTAQSGVIFSLGTSDGGTFEYLSDYPHGAASTLVQSSQLGSTVPNNIPLDLKPHAIQLWLDPAAAHHFTVDDTDATAPSVALTKDVNNVTVGRPPTGSSFTGHYSFAFLLMCSAKPSAAELQALKDWTQHYWGVGNQRPPLPASAIEYWHSEIECTPSAWVGQLRRVSLAGVGTPTVAPDTGYFGGRSVAQTFQTGKLFYNRAISPALISAGTRPWMFIINRLRADGGGTYSEAGFGAAAMGTTGLQVQTGTLRAVFNNGAVIVPTIPADLNAHQSEMWFDGANANAIVDGTAFTVASAAQNPADVSQVALGSLATTDAQFCDTSTAFILLCSTKPSDPEIAALRNWANSYWSVATNRPPLDPLMVEYWHSELGVTQSTGVDSWTGQLRGTVVPWSNARPTYGADSTYFKSRSVIKTGSGTLIGTGLASLAAAGSRPYIFVVCRPSQNAQTFDQLTFALGNAELELRVVDAGGFNNYAAISSAGSVIGPNGSYNGLPHVFQAWADAGAAGLTLRVDNNTYPRNITTSGVVAACTSVAFGSNTWVSNTSHAFAAIFSAKPSDTYIAQLRAWVLNYWGV